MHRKSEKIHIRIADTGIGIPKERFKQIFDDFYQVEMATTRKSEGMGLGLPIAKGLVEAHQGEVKVDSILGKGSQFEVILPISVNI